MLTLVWAKWGGAGPGAERENGNSFPFLRVCLRHASGVDLQSLFASIGSLVLRKFWGWLTVTYKACSLLILELLCSCHTGPQQRVLLILILQPSPLLIPVREEWVYWHRVWIRVHLSYLRGSCKATCASAAELEGAHPCDHRHTPWV
jgi:hypothetical protein